MVKAERKWEKWAGTKMGPDQLGSLILIRIEALAYFLVLECLLFL